MKKIIKLTFEGQQIYCPKNRGKTILVHGPASLHAWGAEDVPGHRSITERILPMEETAAEQEAEGK